MCRFAAQSQRPEGDVLSLSKGFRKKLDEPLKPFGTVHKVNYYMEDPARYRHPVLKM